MFEKAQIVAKQAKQWMSVRSNKRESVASVSRDYRNIIEGLQVKSSVQTLLSCMLEVCCFIYNIYIVLISVNC